MADMDIVEREEYEEHGGDEADGIMKHDCTSTEVIFDRFNGYIDALDDEIDENDESGLIFEVLFSPLLLSFCQCCTICLSGTML